MGARVVCVQSEPYYETHRPILIWTVCGHTRVFLFGSSLQPELYELFHLPSIAFFFNFEKLPFDIWIMRQIVLPRHMDRTRLLKYKIHF